MHEAGRSRRPWRLNARARIVFDVFLATALTAGSFLMLSIGVWPTLLSLAQTLPLFVRRSHPVLCFTLVSLAHALQAVTFEVITWGQLAFPIALYSLARFSRPLMGWLGFGVGMIGTFTASILWTQGFNAQTPVEYQETLTLSSYVPLFLSVGATVITGWALGTQGRVREAYEATLLERGERLAAQAEQRATMAAADERARIAREMHDVVAHGLSVIIVQADGARYAAEQHPDIAVEVLETVSTTGRDALAEMRRLLGLLRGTTDPDLAPQPGLEDLAGLVGEHLPTGQVELPDPPPDVAPGVGLTAYRIVQESLTNIRKHAGPDVTATIRVAAEVDTLRVEVVDNGRGAASGHGSGLGLVGMRERVEVHGGTLAVGPQSGGGWAVRARIPL
ncbi:sensor histidine kinase [Aeromicrobium sp. CTD01-1L150]|uniref:sensor histidine kinase n=1 Tax=Aeromicrobium sp. CTD01-1L150 TaxID=3341830 RepID=UPI0035BF35AD